jgi:hypothetical protein
VVRGKGEKIMKKMKVKKISKRKQIRKIEKQLPKAYRPISGWGYFWRTVLYSIPVLGWLILLFNAIGAKNRNVRYFARTPFCALLLALILTVVAVVVDLLLLKGAMLAWVKELIADIVAAANATV